MSDLLPELPSKLKWIVSITLVCVVIVAITPALWVMDHAHAAEKKQTATFEERMLAQNKASKDEDLQIKRDVAKMQNKGQYRETRNQFRWARRNLLNGATDEQTVLMYEDLLTEMNELEELLSLPKTIRDNY